MSNKLKIIFFGTPDFVIPVLKALVENFEVVGVVTTQDTHQGRHKTLTPTPVKKYAEENIQNASVITSRQLNDTTAQKLRNLNPDFFVVAAFGQIISKNILEIPKIAAINIHPSLLPKYRGPSPIQTALLNDEKNNGITLIEMDEEVDHGPILKKIPFEVLENDTFYSLHTKMFQKAAEELPSVINDLKNGTLIPVPQNHENATFTEHVAREDGFIDISKVDTLSPLEIGNLKLEIARKIRAYFPWPTVWTRVRIKNNEERIMKFLPENKIQLEGGKPMSHKDFLNGHPEMREVLEKIFEE